MPIEVTVIDVRTTAHRLAAITRVGEIEMTSAADMVANVIAKLEATRERPAGICPAPTLATGWWRRGCPA